MNNPFVLSKNERRLAHKFLTLQQKGIFPKPVYKMTLNDYFALIKEACLAHCDATGFYTSPLFTDTKINYAEINPLECAKRSMDGRSLFHSDYPRQKCLLNEINPNSPEEFKEWVLRADYGGHPYEHFTGNFVPYPIKEKGEFTDDWLVHFSNAHRSIPLSLRSYIYMIQKNLPVLYDIGNSDGADMVNQYLTKKYAINIDQIKNTLN
jgi:hypothetical protein